MKKIISVFISMTLIFVVMLSFGITAFASNLQTANLDDPSTFERWNCGGSAYCEYNPTEKTLYIFGSGSVTSTPWDSVSGNIERIYVSRGITALPKGAFQNCMQLVDLTIPFVGASRTALERDAILGYFFSSESAYYSLERLSYKDRNYISSSYTRYIDVKVSYSSYSAGTEWCHTGSWSSCYRRSPNGDINTSLQYTASVKSEAFVNGYIDKIPSQYIWQYSAINNSGTYTAQQNGSDYYDKWTTEYFLQSYYYKIPTTLKYITITDDSSIGVAAFNGCTMLESISCEKTQIFGDYAFQNCTATINQGDRQGSCETTVNGVTYLYNLDKNNEAIIVDCYGDLENINIPEELDSYKVVTVGARAFWDKNTIKSISLPNTLSRINDYAFFGCSALSNITIPNSCESIGNYAFSGCSNLSEITISEGVKEIGYSCFADCISLVNVSIPDSCTFLGDYAFNSCTSLESVVIGTSLLNIGDYAFYNCSSLSSAVMGYEVTEIGDYAFYGTAITKATLPTKAKSIGNYAFANCSELTQVKCAGNLETIGNHAFDNDAKLESINLPSKLTSIGNYAFYKCSVLNNITLPVGVSEVEAYTFAYCNALSDIEVLGALKSIGANAFYYCNISEFNFSEGLGSLGASSFYKNQFVSITLPDSLSSVGSQAFSDCEKLTSISIPDDITLAAKALYNNADELTVTIRNKTGEIGANILKNNLFKHLVIGEGITTIGDSAFASCSTMTDVRLPSSLKAIGISSFQACTGITKITLPDAVKTLGNNSFRNCTSLEIADMPSSLTSIGDSAFQGCTKLKNVLLPSGINKIGASAFNGASSLESIAIPDSVASIGANAFSRSGTYSDLTVSVYFNSGKIIDNLFGGQKIEYLIIGDSIHTIGNSSFASCTTLKGVTLADSVATIGNEAFLGCVKLSSISLSDKIGSIGSDCFKNSNKATLTIKTVDGLIDANIFNGKLSGVSIVKIDNSDIGDSAFKNNTSITTVNIAPISNTHTIESIGKEAFYGCTLLKSISLPDTLTSLGEGAFYNCSSLTAIIIPGNVEKILDSTFYGCSSLSSIELHNGITSLGSYTFYGCSSLAEIQLPNSIPAVEEYAFYECSSLESILIPNSVLEIDDYAFAGCLKLRTVNLSNACETIGDYAFYNCKSLEYLTLPDVLTSVGEYAFRSCSSLKELIFGNSVESIGAAALYECTSLSTVKLGTKIIDIPEKMFYACTGLDVLYIYAPISSFGTLAFYGANNLTAHIGNDPYMINYFDDNAISYVVMDDYEYQYRVVFENENGDVISSNLYSLGEMPVVPQNPYKESNLTYRYIFAGWGSDVSTVSKNTVYRAVFNEEFIEYSVIFKNEDGTILSEKNYHYGETVVIPAIPQKASDKTYTYAFNGWNNAVTTCTEDAVYTATYTPKFIDYSIVFYDYDGTVISSNTYHYGESVSIPQNPTRATDKVGTYSFNGWNRNIAENCDGNAEYIATYTIEYTDYTVVFKDYDGSVLSSSVYHYGDNVSVPSNPTRKADAIYTYSFNGWNKAVTKCEDNAVYTAVYKSTYIEYEIVFRNENGAEISKKNYHYGETIVQPATPTKASNKVYRYEFAGWNKTVVNCVGHAIYTATFSSHFIDYTIIFKNEDGTELSRNTYHYGDEVTVPTTPTKAADNTYTYIFKSWNKEVVACAGDATYTAIYNSTYIDYTVIFKNEDGSVINSKTYHYGDIVKVPETPTKAADNTYTYTFAGWDSEVVACDGYKVYTATYTPIYIEYTVVFKDWNGNEISSNKYHYGQSVTRPINPTRDADNTYTYAFTGWDKIITSCTESTVYTATYSSTYIEYTIVFKNYDGTILSTNKYYYGDTVAAPEAPTKPADESYTYGFAGWDSEVTACLGNKTYIATFNPTNVEYTVVFKDWNGNIISSETYYFGAEVVVPENPTRNADNTYTYTFKNWDKTVAENCVGDAEYTAVYETTYIEYNIKFLNWDGSLIQTVKYHYGDTINAIADPERESDETYTYTFLSWNKPLGVCTGNASFTAQYESTFINYTVVFKDYDGSVISRKTYHFGDIITIPADPVRASDDTYSYTFKNWGNISTSCNGNKEYTANYEATYIDYTVVFNNHDGSVIITKTYHYGDEVTVPATPTKAADNAYTYTFAGWDSEVVDCAGNATYTATYDSHFIDYTVIFKNEDGTVLSSNTYHYGDEVVVPTTPTKDADNTYTYTFKAWDAEVVDCTGNATYTATYDSHFIDYTVTFKNEDGTVLSTNTYHYSDELTVPETPTKAADNTYTYTFKAWDSEVVDCAGNATYTATYDSHYIDYTVTFKNEDGTVLSTNTYHYSDELTIPEAPTKAADNTYTYTFKAWDEEVVACAGNATYTATYDSHYIDYTVTFKNEDGTVLSTKIYHYGDTIAEPTIPTKDSDSYKYVFSGWNDIVVICNGNAVYTATFEKDGLSGGSIAGIAGGSTAVAAMGGFSLFWFVIKKKKFADLIKIIKK